MKKEAKLAELLKQGERIMRSENINFNLVKEILDEADILYLGIENPGKLGKDYLLMRQKYSLRQNN